MEMSASISSSNGIAISTEDGTFRLDPGRTVIGDFNVISHAHSDHLPRGGKETSVIASRKTLELARMRTRKQYTATKHGSVKLLEAGHVPGSKMVYVRDELSYLYTGDFCTKRKVYLENAKAVKTDVLFVESTYGLPRYTFPDPVELAGVIRDWTADSLSRGNSVLFSLYPLGKAQEMQVILKGMPIYADESVQRHNSIVFGRENWVKPVSELRSEPSVVISSGRRIMGTLPHSIRRKLLTATASGWSSDGGYRGRGGYDEAFPLSDHCDYEDLMQFVRKCSPSMVYTVHGFDRELASSIRKDLGIEAEALRSRAMQKQRRIDSF